MEAKTLLGDAKTLLGRTPSWGEHAPSSLRMRCSLRCTMVFIASNGQSHKWARVDERMPANVQPNWRCGQGMRCDAGTGRESRVTTTVCVEALEARRSAGASPALICLHRATSAPRCLLGPSRVSVSTPAEREHPPAGRAE